mgnify:CR=1 FL=1
MLFRSVATKTSYAIFLLHSLFESGVLGLETANTRSLIFNVKGEDLLFLDQPNAGLDDEQRARYAALGLGEFNDSEHDRWRPAIPASGRQRHWRWAPVQANNTRTTWLNGR